MILKRNRKNQFSRVGKISKRLRLKSKVQSEAIAISDLRTYKSKI